MTKSVATLTFILLACAVSAAPPGVQSTPAGPGPVSAQPIPQLVPSADAETPSSQGPFCAEATVGQPEPMPQANLCKLQCKVDYIDCLEIYPAFECEASYQLCLSNC